jgi:hypothetical protein
MSVEDYIAFCAASDRESFYQLWLLANTDLGEWE